MYCLVMPSTSSSVFDLSKNDRILSRRIQNRLTARKVKWAKKTVLQREIRAQIDREFERELCESQNALERLESENDTLKRTAAEIIDRCAALLSPVTPTLVQKDWSVPNYDLDSAYSSDSEIEFFSTPSINLLSKTKF